MSLPDLTPEQRQAALAKAKEVRLARSALLREVRTGRKTAADVLAQADSDPVAGKLKVSSLLKSIPGVGPISARRLMERLDIIPNRRCRGLGPKQRNLLLEELTPR